MCCTFRIMFGHGYAPRAVISSTDMAGCLITVLVLFGQHTCPVSFVPGTNPEETQRAMLTAILSAFSDKLPPKSSLILQIRDDEWGGGHVCGLDFPGSTGQKCCKGACG